MQRIEDLDLISTPYPNAVVTIGNFDGVHKGHQLLIDQVRRKADDINGTAIAVTFEPHPLRVLKSDKTLALITLYEQKMELLAQTDLDVLICIPFTADFANLSPKQFVEDILVKRIGAKAIVVGPDYAFGKNREGSIQFLQECAPELGYELIVVDWAQLPDIKAGRISSTRIREVITAGRMEEAREMLGRVYQIRGLVERGRDRGGKLLGFPTANIHLQDELCPKAGVYAVTVECRQGKFKGVANIGFSPTFEDHVFTVEVHILDFKADLYGQKIRVNFVRRLRDEQKFSGIEELAEQIRKDIALARQMLS